MKKLILILTILTFGISVSAQTPNMQWKKMHTAGGNEDDLYSLYMNSDLSIIVNLIKSNTIFFSGVKKINANGDSVFTKIDTDTNSSTNSNGCVELSNSIAYVSKNSSLGTNLIFRTKDSGNFISKIQVLGYQNVTALSNWKDTLICVFGEGSGISVYDNQGNLKRSFSTGFSPKINITTRILGNNLWIFTNRYNPTLRGVVAKYNLLNGQLLWTQEIDSVIKSFGDIDSLGNSYLTSSCFNPSLNLMDLRTKKFDVNGNVLWDKRSVVNKTNTANMENFITSVAVNVKKGIVVIGCQVEKDSLLNTSKIAGYVLARKISNGDSCFAFKVYGDEIATTNFVQDIKFNSLNEMILLIKTREATWTPKNRFYLMKYIIDTLTGITGNFHGENKEFKLSQNYPNPFNPKTKINFSLSKKAFVTLKVYDMLGKEIETLVHEVKHAGNYSVDFNGKNLPSGTYFYKIETDEHSETKKMTLAK